MADWWDQNSEPDSGGVAAPAASPVLAGIPNTGKPTRPIHLPGWYPMARVALDEAPMVLSAIGGGLGGAGGAVFGAGAGGAPGALEGAALGGAAGQALRRAGHTYLRSLGLPENPPPSAGRQVADVAGQAAIGAGSELAGRGVVRLGRGVAGHLMRGALSPNKPVMQEAVSVASRAAGRRVAPSEADLAEQAIRERIPVGPGPGGTGSNIIEQRISEAAGKLDEMLADAGKRGTRYTAHDFVGPVAELRAQVAKEATPMPALDALDKKVAAFVAARRLPRTANGRMGKMVQLTPSEANELKRVWQDAADEIYRARAGGAAVGPRQTLTARFNESVARGARESLEGIPGVREQNSVLSRLMPLRDAIVDAEMRKPGASPLLPPALRWFVPPPLAGPAVASRAALALTDPGAELIMRNSARLAQTVLGPLGGYGFDNSEPANDAEAQRLAGVADSARALAHHRWGKR